MKLILIVLMLVTTQVSHGADDYKNRITASLHEYSTLNGLSYQLNYFREFSDKHILGVFFARKSGGNNFGASHLFSFSEKHNINSWIISNELFLRKKNQESSFGINAYIGYQWFLMDRLVLSLEAGPGYNSEDSFDFNGRVGIGFNF